MAQGGGEAGSHREPAPAFPILVIGEYDLTVYRTEARYRSRLARASDHALGSGYFRTLQIFDAHCREFAIADLQLAGREWFLAGLRRRPIEALRFAHVSEAVAIEHVKTAVLEAIDEKWFAVHNYPDLPALIARVESCASFAELCLLFGSEVSGR